MHSGGWKRSFDVGLTALVVAYFFTTVAVFRDFGISYDERLNLENGERILDAYRGEPYEAGYPTMEAYGGGFDLPATVATKLIPWPRYEVRHFLTALVAEVGLVATGLLAKALGGAAAARWAVLLLGTHPLWFGHQFANPKDIPFATGVVVTLWLLVRTRAKALGRGGRVSLLDDLGLAAAFGWTLGVRVGGGIFAPVIALVYFERWRAAEPEAKRAVVGRFLLFAALAWSVMVAVWPWTWSSPFLRPWQALSIQADYPWTGTARYLGRDLTAAEIPRHYLPLHFLIMSPESLLVAWLVGIVASWRGRRGGRVCSLVGSGCAIRIVGLAAALPLIIIVGSGRPVYDGMRHGLFVLPLLTVLGAAGLSALTARPCARGARILAGLAMGALLAWNVERMVRLHPYQANFYNSLVGGLSGAAGRFEADYWLTSYREAGLELAKILERDHPAGIEGRRVRVKAHLGAAGVEGALPSSVELVSETGLADYHVLSTRWGRHDSVPGIEVCRVEREGVLLTVVKRALPPRTR